MIRDVCLRDYWLSDPHIFTEQIIKGRVWESVTTGVREVQSENFGLVSSVCF